jgi:hypothetical protein
LNINGNSGVDFTTQGDTRYGFENFVTQNDPGYDANTAFSGNGSYAQTVNAAALAEGYHYITARAYRQRSDGGADIYNDFKKVIYVDRLPPQSGIAGVTQSGSGSGRTLGVSVQSVDQTADNVHVLMDTGAALSDAQILAMLNSGSASTQLDLDLFSKSITGITNGTHAMTIVTREITGNYSIIRATGVGITGGNGLGFGDTNASGSVDTSDISTFSNVLESNDLQFNAGAEANSDGRITLADAFLLGPRLTQVGASAPTVSAYNSMINGSYVTNGTYTVDANHTVHDVTAGDTHVLGGATLTARSIRRGDVAIDDGGRINIQSRANGGSAVHMNTLSLAPNGVLDTADQDLVVNQGVFTNIQNLVIAGFGSDSAITSSTSDGSQILALFDNALVLANDWNGTPISASAIVGKYTYFGDMNIDGQVTGDDYTVVDANLSTTPLAGLAWLSGDANLDGTITGDDYTVIDANLGLGLGNPLMSARLSALPEPASFAAIVGVSIMMNRRRMNGRRR